MTTLFLVRHGETVWHAEHRYAGMADVELTDEGFRQAEALALWSADARLDAVYSSTLSRAVLTAEPSARVLGEIVETDPDLCEVAFGIGEGRTLDELRPEHSDAVNAFEARPAEAVLPGGERGLDGITRYLRAFDRIEAAFPDGRVLVSCHGTALRLTLCAMLGIDPNRYRDLMPVVQNCAVTAISYVDGAARLYAFNVPADVAAHRY
ncbi:MAG TPA: histidine phosphatase family protein [Mycetocola sp.]|jgi:broad specificity phosphatase PhoE|uniref:histidine phosphatase family protein n=1 Tax=Mycetocola sp. TaxID=1871042 RepID=UPI0026347815|nr:histidine phosphatase family protein [Mycetocola sp.]MCU1559277.1 putative phosphoglycerate mutase [Mycetocola sp.]HEV7849101.1 histidine phosphatase family protein [Mycetocola sp.]